MFGVGYVCVVVEVEVKAGDDKGNMHAAISAIAVHTLQDKGSSRSDIVKAI